jgi:hypothetical protein
MTNYAKRLLLACAAVLVLTNFLVVWFITYVGGSFFAALISALLADVVITLAIVFFMWQKGRKTAA